MYICNDIKTGWLIICVNCNGTMDRCWNFSVTYNVDLPDCTQIVKLVSLGEKALKVQN